MDGLGELGVWKTLDYAVAVLNHVLSELPNRLRLGARAGLGWDAVNARHFMAPLAGFASMPVDGVGSVPSAIHLRGESYL